MTSSLVTRTLPFAVPKWFVGEAGLVMLSSQLAKRCGEDGGGDEYDDVRGDAHDDEEHDEHGDGQGDTNKVAT